MAPLGVGGIQLMDPTVMTEQDAIKLAIQEFQMKLRERDNLRDNKNTLHKYILTVFCLYCRHLHIIHKQQKLKIIEAIQKSRKILKENKQKFQQMTMLMGPRSAISRTLAKITFLQMNHELNATNILHKHKTAFFNKILGVYYAFDRLVNKLDSKIKEKSDKVEREIAVYQLRIQNTKSTGNAEINNIINNNNNNNNNNHTVNINCGRKVKREGSVTSNNTGLTDIKKDFKELKMDIDGDSDNEDAINNDHINHNKNIQHNKDKNVAANGGVAGVAAISDQEMATLQQLLRQSQQKNPQDFALQQLASLLGPGSLPPVNNNGTNNNNNNNQPMVLIQRPQPMAIVATTAVNGGVNGIPSFIPIANGLFFYFVDFIVFLCECFLFESLMPINMYNV